MDGWITTTEASELTGYSTACFRQLMRSGRLQGNKLWRDWFLDGEIVLSCVKRLRDLGPEKKRTSQEARPGTLFRSFPCFSKVKCYNQ